eukprot:3963745-Lingulodinium_polyedra.AAC.1
MCVITVRAPTLLPPLSHGYRGCKTFGTTKSTIRAEASQGAMLTRALTGARADTCTSNGSPEIGN